MFYIVVGILIESLDHAKKDLLVEDDKNKKNKRVGVLLEVDHQQVFGLKKEVIKSIMIKNPKVSLTMLYFDRECYNSIIKKLESHKVSSSNVKGTSSQFNLFEVSKESDTTEASTSN